MPSADYIKALTPYHVTVTDADTEYELELPEDTKYLRVVTVDASAFRLAFVTGKVAAASALTRLSEDNGIELENAYGSWKRSKKAGNARHHRGKSLHVRARLSAQRSKQGSHNQPIDCAPNVRSIMGIGDHPRIGPLIHVNAAGAEQDDIAEDRISLAA